jgi:hypothetical protein
MASIKLRLDPWPAEYESSFQIEEFEEELRGEVDADVEGVGWVAIEPPPIQRPEPLHFVDGVRRVEARIIVDDESGRINRGLFGSIAVGAVRVERNKATFETVCVKRYIVLGGGMSLEAPSIREAETVRVGNLQLAFDPIAVPDGGPVAPIAGLQNLMRTEEASIAERLATESACVFADGPLTYFSGIKQPAVGVIKRLMEPYLSASQFELVRKIETGQRTPLFVIPKTKYDRYSWYLRVGSPRPMDHDIAGVLRLEVRTGVGLGRAVELANLSAACLPVFASDSFRDPRSPQNLLPIGSLETKLRHRLGDALAIRRALETKLFRMSNQ